MLRPASGALLLTCLVIALACGQASAQKATKERPGGFQWDYRVRDGSGNLVEEGKFLANDHTLYNKGNPIGTYKDVAPDRVSVEITKGKLMGKLELRSNGGTPPIWTGDLVRPDGSKYNATITFARAVKPKG